MLCKWVCIKRIDTVTKGLIRMNADTRVVATTMRVIVVVVWYERCGSQHVLIVRGAGCQCSLDLEDVALGTFLQNSCSQLVWV